MKHIDKDILQEIVNSSNSKRECLEKLKMHNTSSTSYKTLNYFLKLYDIDTSHYKGYNIDGLTKGQNKEKIDIDEILNGKHPLYNRSRLKDRIIKLKILERCCNNCKNDSWLGEPIPLELEHKDGNPINHKLENLELLCPNCHALTPTYCGKNVKKTSRRKIISEKFKKRREINDLNNSNKVKIVENSLIDFSKFGWVIELSKLVDMKPQKINGWMKRYMPKFYDERCFKKKRQG